MSTNIMQYPDGGVQIGGELTTSPGPGNLRVIGSISANGTESAAGSTGQVQVNTAGVLAASASLTFASGVLGVVGSVKSIAAATQDAVALAGRAGGTGSWVATITPTTLSASRTITIPNATGTLALLESANVFTALQSVTGLKVNEGANARMGVVDLTSGAATVATTAVSATSRIFLCCQASAGTPGFLYVSARTAATSFDITSSSGTDTSSVAWLIIDPA